MQRYKQKNAFKSTEQATIMQQKHGLCLSLYGFLLQIQIVNICLYLILELLLSLHP